MQKLTCFISESAYSSMPISHSPGKSTMATTEKALATPVDGALRNLVRPTSNTTVTAARTARMVALMRVYSPFSSSSSSSSWSSSVSWSPSS